MPRREKNKTHRVAVIGRTGRGDYGHGLDLVWREVEGVEIVAVADEDAAGRAAAAARLGGVRAYADYREMLAKERPSVVSVGPRWIDAHRDMALACAEHGASVFLEKPFCRTLAEGDEIVHACDMAHVKLAIAHQTRYSPRLRVVEGLIKDGKIGKVLELRGRGKEDRRGGGEDLWVLGTHILDLMRAVAGPARWCFGHVTQGGRPIEHGDVRDGNEGIGPLAGDAVDAVYGFDGGITGHFASRQGAASNPSRFGLLILGTNGAIDLGTGYLPRARHLGIGSWTGGDGGAAWVDISSAGIGQPEPLQDTGLAGGNLAIARDLLRAIEEDRQPLGNAREALGATEMIVAVFASAMLQGKRVSLPLESRASPLARA